MGINVSLCIAGIRTEKWIKLCEQIAQSIQPYNYEIIFCGPYPPPTNLDIKWIPSHRSPTACVQQAILEANGELVMWLSDDGEILEDSLKLAVDSWYNSKNEKCEVIIKYFEGDNITNGGYHTQPEAYWTAHHHGSLRMPGIPAHYLTAPCGLLSKKYFLELGGFDCNFRHINLSCHDLSFRIQNDGGIIVSPPKYVMNCEFSHNIINGRCDCILCKVYVENDLPYLQSIYSNPIALNRIKIPLDNWLTSDEIWERFK